MGRMAVTFDDSAQAREIPELARYANVAAQKRLVEDEFLFIAKYSDIGRKLLTLIPPESVHHP